jgi:uncharacterized protein (DUF58 family)
MNTKTWRQRLSHIALFIPVKLYLLLFGFLLYVAHWWLQQQTPEDPSAMTAVTALLVKVTTTTILAILSLGLLSVVIPFAFFLWQKKRGRIRVTVNNDQTAGKRGMMIQQIKLELEPVWRPLLGFLYYRFVYDENRLSPKFAIVRKQVQKELFKSTATGWYRWPLPSVREYDLEKLVVYFEDLFHFFSFSTSIRVDQSFFTKPTDLALADKDIMPQKTQTEEVRIDELRRVEGEYLNYKQFEGNDDVRRIVWKIYAKNRELVVRIQEILDPKASHIYLYCSFWDGLGVEDSWIMQTRALDAYKNACWSLYRNLNKQGRLVRFVPDQPLPARQFHHDAEKVEYQLAASQWQTENELTTYVQPKDAAVLMISSLADLDHLHDLVDRLDGQVHIIMVPLSQAIAWKPVQKWLQWIFVKPEKDREKSEFSDLGRARMLRRLRQREKDLAQFLQKSGHPTLSVKS